MLLLDLDDLISPRLSHWGLVYVHRRRFLFRRLVGAISVRRRCPGADVFPSDVIWRQRLSDGRRRRFLFAASRGFPRRCSFHLRSFTEGSNSAYPWALQLSLATPNRMLLFMCLELLYPSG